MIVEERSGLGIVDLAGGIVIPFEEGLAAQQLAHDGVACLGEHGLAFGHLAPGRRHPLQRGARKPPQVEIGRPALKGRAAPYCHPRSVKLRNAPSCKGAVLPS